MARRRRFTEREVLETLALQGVLVWCYRCHVVLDPRTAEREHLLEVALGGPDIPANCAYSCDKCHLTVTNGTKATTAGSSKQRIAKVKRIRAGGKKKKGPRIKSRPFPKKQATDVTRSSQETPSQTQPTKQPTPWRSQQSRQLRSKSFRSGRSTST